MSTPGPKPEPMSDGRLKWISSVIKASDGPANGHLRELLSDRDYHYQRAEAGEAEAAQLLADLAAMKRERDAAKKDAAQWKSLADERGREASAAWADAEWERRR